ncbi:response regulator [Desulfovibrio inopinatus]|uniref:response regulator n=1 Tax=Desulfovibrio inopinatus TaxID=102109 RepID=UPI0004197BC2|nr:response regulator [Desulfovibrio inopinatus]
MKRALIIEDNENNLELISFILKANGYTSLSAINGQDGVEAALRELPDFILLDIQLPDIPGTEVLRQLRAQSETASIPIIAVTSYAMAGDRERLLAAGCDGYIEKPIDPVLVMKQIEKILKEF